MICVWLDEDDKLHTWDTEKGEYQISDVQSTSHVKDLRISGDGSKVFVLGEKSIQAWSIQTGEVVGQVRLEVEPLYDSLIGDGSGVWFFWRIWKSRCGTLESQIQPPFHYPTLPQTNPDRKSVV